MRTFEKLCEEKPAEYAQMKLELQVEKRQRIAEYTARQSELDRVQDEHEKDIKRTQQAREEYERQRRKSEQPIQELREAQTMSEATRGRGNGKLLDEIQQQTELVVI